MTAAVLFDLDGTLIDSIGLILRSFRHTFEAHKKRELTEAEWLAGVGTPLHRQFATHADDEAELQAMIRTYRSWNAEHHDELVDAYPGAVDGARALAQRGMRLGVVTSKARTPALRGLEVGGFGDLFEIVVGADDVELHKPDPTPVLFALERLAVEPADAVYVGDSPHDMHAGRRAGVLTAAALWGPFTRADLAPTRPDLWLEAPSEIAGIAQASFP